MVCAKRCYPRFLPFSRPTRGASLRILLSPGGGEAWGYVKEVTMVQTSPHLGAPHMTRIINDFADAFEEACRPLEGGDAVTSSSGARDTSSMWGRLTALLQRTREEGGLTRGQATVAMLVATSLAAATLRARRSSSFRRPSSSAPARGRAKKWAQGLLPWGGTGESKGAETTLGERLKSPRRRRERCTVAQEPARIKDFPTFLKDEQQRL